MLEDSLSISLKFDRVRRITTIGTGQAVNTSKSSRPSRDPEEPPKDPKDHRGTSTTEEAEEPSERTLYSSREYSINPNYSYPLYQCLVLNIVSEMVLNSSVLYSG